MSIQIDERRIKKFSITDIVLMSEIFSDEELEIYKRVRGTMNSTGYTLEEYLDWKSKDMPNVKFVGRKKNRPKQTDFIIDGKKWSIKNSQSGENSTTKDYRENYVGVTNHWFRVDTNGDYHWRTCPIPGCSEEEFIKFMSTSKPGLNTSALCEFFGDN